MYSTIVCFWSLFVTFITASPPHMRVSLQLEFDFDIPPRTSQTEKLENSTNLHIGSAEKGEKLDRSNLLVEEDKRLGVHSSLEIVGGEDAAPGEFPFQVSIFEKHYSSEPRFNFCGGSVYNELYVLTAAHCLRRMNPLTGFFVIAGEYNLKKNDGTEQVRQIERKIRHEKYLSYPNGYYDIALLKVNKKFTFDKFVQPVPMPTKVNLASLDVSRTLCTITGWGSLSELGDIPAVLQKVDVPLVPDDLCQKLYSDQELFPKQNVCAGYMKGGKDSCSGDSGGPMTCNGTIVGITSWGIGCAEPGQPGVYTEVAFFLDWIENNIN